MPLLQLPCSYFSAYYPFSISFSCFGTRSLFVSLRGKEHVLFQSFFCGSGIYWSEIPFPAPRSGSGCKQSEPFSLLVPLCCLEEKSTGFRFSAATRSRRVLLQLPATRTVILSPAWFLFSGSDKGSTSFPLQSLLGKAWGRGIWCLGKFSLGFGVRFFFFNWFFFSFFERRIPPPSPPQAFSSR